MPVFTYKAKAATGSLLSGVVEAAEEKAALEKLRTQKLFVLELAPKVVGPLESLGKLFKSQPKIPSKDIVIFSRQLSTLISAGVPIVQGLSILESQMQNKNFRKVIAVIRADIESGMSISDALRKHPQGFSKLYVAMVRAGEVGGILDSILERLTSYIENAQALRAKVKSALMYPAIVLLICAGVTVFLLTFVIPVFEKIFKSMGNSALPAPTQMVVNISHWLRSDWYLIIGGIAALWYGFKKFYATPFGKNWLDGKFLKAPVFGPLLKKVAVAQMSRTLGTLLKAGVPIMQGLETVMETVGNAVISASISKSRDSIREGGNLADPLQKSGLFPPMVTSMISVGEQTGSLDAMLEKIAEFYDVEVDAAVKGMTSLIEPVVIVIMGVIVGAIAIAMYMPIFNMGQLASKAAG